MMARFKPFDIRTFFTFGINILFPFLKPLSPSPPKKMFWYKLDIGLKLPWMKNFLDKLSVVKPFEKKEK